MHSLEHLMMQHRPTGDRTVVELIEAWGGEANAETAREHLLLWAAVPPGRVAATAALLASALTADLDPDSWDAEREVILDELAQRDGSTAQLAPDLLYTEVFERPWANPVGGTAAVVARLTVADVEEFRSASVLSGVVGWAAAGPVELADLPAVGHPAVTRTAPRGALRPRHGSRVLQREQDGLACVCIGGPAAAMPSGHRLADDVVAAALGGSANSRLYRRLRSELGLAYHVDARASHFARVGLWRARVLSATVSTDRLAESVRDELVTLRRAGLSDVELEAAREFVVGQQLLRDETASDRMNGIGRHRLIGGLDGWTRATDVATIRSLSCGQLRDRAASLLADPVVVAVGP